MLGLVLCLWVSGCSQMHKKGDKQAQRRWDGVRSRIKYQLAKQQYEAGMPEDAARTAVEAVALDGTSADAYELIVKSYLEQGDLPSVERALMMAFEAGVRTPALMYLNGVRLEQQGRLMEAVEAYDRARSARPDQTDYVVAQAECMVACDMPDAALKLLAAVPRDQADHGTLDALVARIAEKVGDLTTADTHYRRALKQISSPSMTLDYALLLMRERRFNSARALLEPLVVGQEGGLIPGAAVRALARCDLALNDPAGAFRALVDHARAHPEDVQAQLLLATAGLACGRVTAAARACRSVLEADPDNVDALLLQATAFMRDGRYAFSWRVIQRVLDRDPENALAGIVKGTLIRRMEASASRASEAPNVMALTGTAPRDSTASSHRVVDDLP